MEFLALNSTILSPRGFQVRVRGPREGLSVAPHRLWGRDEVAALRQAPFVRVAPGPDDDVLATTVALALAGVPVSAQGVPATVRARLDPQLRQTMEQIDPQSAADPAARELASLELRRRAWQVAGYRPATAEPEVLVLLPAGELPASLINDLAAQQTPGVRVRQHQGDDLEELGALLRQERPCYLTRMEPGLRYGPHHLADLIHALAHSGAAVALSPRRFTPWRAGAWLESQAGPTEAPAAHGLAGGSLWYADAGPDEPAADGQGYAVHGANAVPVAAATEDAAEPATSEPGSSDPGTSQPTTPDQEQLAPLQLHRRLPRVLSWLQDQAATLSTQQPGDDHDPVEPSYFATSGSGAP